jgi:hypothetical protein
MEFLFENQILVPRAPESVVSNDLIVYLDNGVFRHVGRIAEPDRVLSKWGTGHLYQHAVWEVPASYGEEICYFVGTDEDMSFGLFRAYAESRGFTFGESTP